MKMMTRTLLVHIWIFFQVYLAAVSGLFENMLSAQMCGAFSDTLFFFCFITFCKM